MSGTHKTRSLLLFPSTEEVKNGALPRGLEPRIIYALPTSMQTKCRRWSSNMLEFILLIRTAQTSPKMLDTESYLNNWMHTYEVFRKIQSRWLCCSVSNYFLNFISMIPSQKAIQMFVGKWKRSQLVAIETSWRMSGMYQVCTRIYYQLGIQRQWWISLLFWRRERKRKRKELRIDRIVHSGGRPR